MGKAEGRGGGRETKRALADCNAPCQFPKLSKATWIYGSFRSNEIPRVRGFSSSDYECLGRGMPTMPRYRHLLTRLKGASFPSDYIYVLIKSSLVSILVTAREE